MAKKYTRAQWTRLQARFPEEDRIPYDQSPDVQDVVQSAGSEMSGGMVSTTPRPAADPNRPNVREDRIPTETVTTPTATTVTGPTLVAGPTVGTGTGTGTKSTGPTYMPGSTTSTPALFTATDGTKFWDEKSYREYQDYISGKRAARQSAFDLLYEQFSQYGLGSLVEPIRGLITDSSVSPSEYVIRLRQTEPYKKRFAANASRVANGLAALSEADYLNYEDRYQNIMRNYGLPASYYEKGDLGVQKNFEKLIANDVRDDELIDRLSTAYDRVINASPEVSQALKTFYPGITNGDIVAYVLDPENAKTEIKRKVTAAEIGGAALQFGLQANLAGAEALAGYGVTQAQARQGYQTIADILPRGSQLASIYKQEPYTQATAESELFGTPGSAEATAKRKKLSQLEQASFSGSAGTSSAISRDRAGAF
jgi:hypothetical protein